MKLVLTAFLAIAWGAGQSDCASLHAESPAAALSSSAAQTAAQTAASTASPDVSGTWVGKLSTPFGELEIVYRLQVKDGMISGSQGLPFGDSPILDGRVEGDSFHLMVELESFGDIQKREVTGKIVGETLVLTPAFPGPPPEAPGAAADKKPKGDRPPFKMTAITVIRGTPAPSYRPGPVDYAHLAPIKLPALRDIPSNRLAATPPMGWNSWNKFQTHIDDKTVRTITDAMVATGMKDLGYEYVIIDDGWQGTRDASGALSPNPNFPDMKALADYVHSKGLKIGIYSSPGPRTCGSFEGSYGHEKQDAETFAAWGMDYLKYDWCSASRIWKDADMRAVYQIMGDALANSGRPIVYALCQYGRADVTAWGSSVGANLWRTTMDIQDKYDSMAGIGFAQSALASAAGPGHWNDPDMLEVGNGGMSSDEYKTHFSLWSMIAAPLIAGNDLRDFTGETLEILTNRDVIAVDQDPLGAGGKRIHNRGSVEVWAKPLASKDTVIAVFNRGARPATTTISLQDAGLSGKYFGRDLWLHTDRDIRAEALKVAISPHGVLMLRLTKAE